MAIPSQTLQELNPGLAAAPAGAAPVLYVGPCSSGTADTVYSFSKLSDLRTTLGYGPLVEYAARGLTTGGPVLCIKAAASTAASETSVTPTRVGSSTGTITVAGDGRDFYEVVVEITTTGDLGAGQFRFSLDDGRTYSPAITIPSGGSYALPNTGLTITFVEGAGPATFDDGDLHSFDATPAMLNGTDLSAALTAIEATPYAPEGIIVCGRFPTASAAATVAGTLQTRMDSLDSIFRYAWAAIDAGGDNAATTISAWSSFTDDRILACYGTSLFPFLFFPLNL